MKSKWLDRDADAVVGQYASDNVARNLALRVYTTRLLGREPELVLHGGGNTSVKMTMADLLGEQVEVICVKGSGSDMAAIEPAGLPALRLDRLRRLRPRDVLSDEEMVRVQRENLLDPMAPNPSVETLLHAFLPHRYVDHTHANAVLSLTDQPNGHAICAELYGKCVGIVDYVMPGFALAKLAAQVYDAQPTVEGLILHKHGIFSFGVDARQSYERMIALVTRAEEYVKRNRRAVFVSSKLPELTAPLATVAPILRGACSLKHDGIEGEWRRLVLDFRSDDEILSFVNGTDLARYGRAGVITPDHVIRTKAWPLVIETPVLGRETAFSVSARAAAAAFVENYRAYFGRNNARVGANKRMLDPLPRVALVPGLGLFGLGRSKKEAKIAADLAASAVKTIANAEAIGRFESISEADLFDMEYWSLEQAKLGAAKELPLAGQIAAITGAGGTIGAAIAKTFASAGAVVALLDRDETAVLSVARSIGAEALAVRCDVTVAGSVTSAFERIIEAFGGLDILISNAGAAWQGRIGEVDEGILRQSFELNFFAHQRVAQAAVRIMSAQGTGGCLLFNVSKQAVSPGRNFGPYGLAKAATLFLVRQYALDHGCDGIRANAVNADHIRSGLLTPDLIAERARARGVSEQDYLQGNLLGREVTADDVAQAFLHQALELKTTGNVTTVDGGNIAAALR